jgi:hypothetical protein
MNLRFGAALARQGVRNWEGWVTSVVLNICDSAFGHFDALKRWEVDWGLLTTDIFPFYPEMGTQRPPSSSSKRKRKKIGPGSGQAQSAPATMGCASSKDLDCGAAAKSRAQADESRKPPRCFSWPASPCPRRLPRKSSELIVGDSDPSGKRQRPTV